MTSVASSVRGLLGRFRSYLIYDLLFGYQKYKLRKLFEPQISDWSLIFDIGGHLGTHTRFFKNYDLDVIIVEPHPHYAKNLYDRFDSDPNVTVLPVGISDRESVMKFYPSPSHPSVSTFNEVMKESITDDPKWKTVVWNDPIEVHTTTLRSLINDYGLPDYIKVDVEGFEDRVVTTVDQVVPCISFEFLPAYPDPALKTLDYLSSLGSYQYYLTSHKSFKNQKWLDYDQMKQVMQSHDGDSGDIFAKLLTPAE